MKQSKWKMDLEPLAELVAAPLAWLWSDERTDEELTAIGQAAIHPTQTNCGWNTYRAAKLVREELPRVLVHRAGLRAGEAL